MKVLICGSREYDNWQFFCAELDRLRERIKYDTIIHGDAPGTDTMAGVYARQRDIPLEVYPADWDQFGKAAGPIRNKQMLDEGKPDLVIAFLSKDSKGTKDMISQSEKSKIKMITYDI